MSVGRCLAAVAFRIVVVAMRRLSCICLAACLLHAVCCTVLFADVETLNRIVRGVSAADREWHGVLALDVRVNRDGMDEPVPGMLDDDPLTSGDTVRAQRVVSYLATHADSTTGRQIRFGVDVLGKAVSCQFTYTLAVHSFMAHRHANSKPFPASGLRSHLVKIQTALAGYIDKLAFFDQDTAGHVRVCRTINDVLAATRDQPPDVQKDRMVEFLGQLVSTTKAWATAGCGLTEGRDMVKLVRLKDYDKRIHGRMWSDVDDNCVVTMINNFDPYEFITFTSNGLEFWTKSLMITEHEMESTTNEENVP